MPKPRISLLPDYQTGIRYLGICLVVLLLLVWWRGIRPTQKLAAANKAYKARLARAGNAGMEAAQLENQLGHLEKSAVRSYDRDLLLGKLSEYCKRSGLLLRNFPATEEHSKNGVDYLTNLIEVEGRFRDITHLAYVLEHKEMLGTIASLGYHLTEDRMSKEKRLRAKIVLRNVKPKDKIGVSQ